MSGAGSPARRGRYSPLVRELFRRAPHGGDLPEGEGRTVKATVREGAAGPSICLFGRSDHERWLALGYRVFGCPHLVAAVEWAVARFEGEAFAAPAPFPVDELMVALDVPVEKTGRILLLEDAFVALERKRREGLDFSG